MRNRNRNRNTGSEVSSSFMLPMKEQETTHNNYKKQQEQQHSLSHVGEVVNPKDSALSPAVQMATLNAR